MIVSNQIHVGDLRGTERFVLVQTGKYLFECDPLPPDVRVTVKHLTDDGWRPILTASGGDTCGYTPYLEPGEYQLSQENLKGVPGVGEQIIGVKIEVVVDP